MKTIWILLAIGTGLYGCALEAPSAEEATTHEPPYDDLDEDIGVKEQAIRGGTEAYLGKRGVVKFTGPNGASCTGVLINKFYLLTAGHCVKPHLGAAFEGEIWGWVHYYRTSGTAPILLHDQGAPMYAWVVPTYRSGSDAQSDLAIVSSNRRGSGFPYITTADYVPISLGTCGQIDRMRVYGQGYNAFAGTGNGILRWTAVNLKHCDTHFFFDLEGSAAICDGDSGGPYIVSLVNGVDAVAGLVSNSEGDHVCTEDGGRQRGVRLSSKMTWIEQKMGFTCRTRSWDGHNYKECF